MTTTPMRITVNGQTREAPAGTTLAQLIELVGLSGQPCAAEVNRAVVPKREHAEHALRDGDTVELVTLVGGG